MDPQTLLDSTFFLIPSFVPKKGLDPQVSANEYYQMKQAHISDSKTECKLKDLH